MNDQEGAAAAQARDEQPQQQTRQSERGSSGGGGHSRERGRRRHSPNQPQRRPETPQLPMDELRDLFALFTEHGLTEFELERESFRVHLGRNLSQSADATTQSQASSAPPLMVSPTPATEGATGQASSSSASAATASAASTQAEQAAAEEESLHIITSPIVGTFYRSPSPTAEPFVRLDSHVSPDTVVCIIEAMKLMNEIQAETSGKVAKIYVENGQPVEYGQPLFGVKK